MENRLERLQTGGCRGKCLFFRRDSPNIRVSINTRRGRPLIFKRGGKNVCNRCTRSGKKRWANNMGPIFQPASTARERPVQSFSSSSSEGAVRRVSLGARWHWHNWPWLLGWAAGTVPVPKKMALALDSAKSECALSIFMTEVVPVLMRLKFLHSLSLFSIQVVFIQSGGSWGKSKEKYGETRGPTELNFVPHIFFFS